MKDLYVVLGEDGVYYVSCSDPDIKVNVIDLDDIYEPRADATPESIIRAKARIARAEALPRVW